ncbi:hypothetical protein DFH09DRAFT_1088054 [Mycena vulgaris]|nr:hypothetical protein DFH09DRAFT_1088054 [Mycena vulgaris]
MGCQRADCNRRDRRACYFQRLERAIRRSKIRKLRRTMIHHHVPCNFAIVSDTARGSSLRQPKGNKRTMTLRSIFEDHQSLLLFAPLPGILSHAFYSESPRDPHRQEAGTGSVLLLFFEIFDPPSKIIQSCTLFTLFCLQTFIHMETILSTSAFGMVTHCTPVTPKQAHISGESSAISVIVPRPPPRYTSRMSLRPLSDFNRFSPDILSRIIDAYCRDDGNLISLPFPSPVICVSRVCRQWRALTHKNPGSGSAIVLNLAEWDLYLLVQDFGLFLSRTKSGKVHLEIIQVEVVVGRETVIRVLAMHSQCLAFLRMHIPAQIVASLLIGRLNISKLSCTQKATNQARRCTRASASVPTF